MTDFDSRTSPMCMGDLINRPSAIKMLGYVYNKKILDAGCGTGYVAKILLDKIADVTLLDHNKDTLQKARNRLKIASVYVGNIYNLPFTQDSFDAVLSISVVMYNLDFVNARFFHEAHRVLKPDGIAVVSGLHPYMFSQRSPAILNQDVPCWLKLKKDKKDANTYLMSYQGLEGAIESIPTQVINYSESDYIQFARNAGFDIEEIKAPIVRKEHLHPALPHWGTHYGYPAYFQMKLRKR
jgi:ubiquinone/menaquinone biosynthesis C-methylase UbiE